MCRDCGCGLHDGGSAQISAHDHDHDHDHDHHHEHHHDHEHDHEHHDHDHHHHDDHDHHHSHALSHSHSHEHSDSTRRTIEIRQSILAKNERLAERNRGFFRARGWLVLNVLSSPGSGKTTLLRETLRMLGPALRTGVIVGDLATDNDARKLRETGAPVVQISTGTVCHLDAEMVARALQAIQRNDLQLLIIENVGNLVCPAAYDLGEDLRVVLLSVTEGEDKPLKYPPMFQGADVVIISKTDLAQACGFERDALVRNVRSLAPKAQLFETSAKTGRGLDEWCEFLKERQKIVAARDPLSV